MTIKKLGIHNPYLLCLLFNFSFADDINTASVSAGSNPDSLSLINSSFQFVDTLFDESDTFINENIVDSYAFYLRNKSTLQPHKKLVSSMLLNQDNKNTPAHAGDTKNECTHRNSSENKFGVELVNSTQLFTYLNNLNNISSWNCLLVMFYYPWCPFSAALGPSYNALGHLFPQLHVLALDAYTYTSAATRFGLVGVPSILLFVNGKVTKYNDTTTLNSLISFVTKHTNFLTDESVKLSELNITGPVPIVPQTGTNYLLIFSTLFVILILIYSAVRSVYFYKVVEFVRNNWREAEAQHLE